MKTLWSFICQISNISKREEHDSFGFHGNPIGRYPPLECGCRYQERGLKREAQLLVFLALQKGNQTPGHCCVGSIAKQLSLNRAFHSRLILSSSQTKLGAGRLGETCCQLAFVLQVVSVENAPPPLFCFLLFFKPSSAHNPKRKPPITCLGKDAVLEALLECLG